MRMIFLTICSFALTVGTGGSSGLPVKEWKSANTIKPLLLYVSGDGGMNSFSTSLCDSLHAAGFDIVALDAKSYFSSRKSVSETCNDLSALLIPLLKQRTDKSVICVGYSFGADILPFVVNGWKKAIPVEKIFLLAPSASTDFETHWSDMMGIYTERSMKVPEEINQLKEPVVILTATDDLAFPFSRLTLKTYKHHILPGKHHFDGRLEEITAIIKPKRN